MEDRIKRMESAILTTQLHVVTEPEDEKSDKIENQAWLSNHLENLVIEAKGCPNFIGILFISQMPRASCLQCSFRLGIWIFTSFPSRPSVDVTNII